MVLQNITQTQSQALLQAAKGKRDQAQKTQFLSEMLKQAEGQQGSASVTAQIQQLHSDVQRLLKSASNSEKQAKEMLQQNAALQLNEVTTNCSPVANRMSSEELFRMVLVSANESGTMGLPQTEAPKANLVAMSKPEEQVVWHSGFNGAAVNVSLAGIRIMDAPSPAAPTKEDFGMDNFNPNGQIGMQTGQCSKKDNCNYRGICKDGICYCQKNYYGPTCSTLRQNKKGSVRLAAVALIAVGCTLSSFIFTLCFLNWSAVQRRNAESKLGYVVV
jgi:hypothetical protein